VLGATNRRDDLDKALLRPGRFDVEVNVSTAPFLCLHRNVDQNIQGHYFV
jgi:ATP-dependent 26S proteasome regulatory subunit